MDIFLVGGAVRDELLGIESTERDWVVVGATEEEMLSSGFRKVGADFPVFLHPETSEEYALARTERKTATGHTGFECDTENVSLEDDLFRRDLTINALARDGAGEIIDPWGGLSDLENRVLRHVSPAFAEDPLRILRVARFAARLHALEFGVAENTMQLMRDMTDQDALGELPAERIAGELDKALSTDHPEVFFDVLGRAGANHQLWPELTDACLERLRRVKQTVEASALRLAALLSPLPEKSIISVSERLRLPNRSRDIAVAAHHHDSGWQEVDHLSASKVVETLYELDGFRQTDRFDSINAILAAATATDAVEANVVEQRWRDLLREAGNVTADAVDPGLSGADIGRALRVARIEHLERSG